MATFKAIEVERASRVPTGRTLELEAETRASAIDALLESLALSSEAAQVDPSRTLVVIGALAWTIVRLAPATIAEAPGLRRAGARHKRVR